MVLTMSPIGPSHADPIDVLTRRLVLAVGDRAVVRVQQPFAASDDSEPEPDLALMPPRRYAADHPRQALLVIEVAQSSLSYDRETKAPLYAESGVPEYWIFDVQGKCVEVHDELNQGRYGRVRVLGAGDSLAPAAFPDAWVDLRDLFVE
jgi:Uma2 family endonuclease